MLLRIIQDQGEGRRRLGENEGLEERGKVEGGEREQLTEE